MARLYAAPLDKLKSEATATRDRMQQALKDYASGKYAAVAQVQVTTLEDLVKGLGGVLSSGLLAALLPFLPWVVGAFLVWWFFFRGKK